MADAGTIICENCRRPIAAANHTVHVSHCRRHLSVCEECGEPVPRDRLAGHRAAEHRRLPCQLCGLQLPAADMETHKEESCAGRAVTCPYCELSMPHSSLEEHESYCGSRTELCPTCEVRVMYRHWPLHVQSGHKLTRPEPDPSAPPRDDCFEQAMLMAIELSKKTAAESQSSECQHCGLKVPADQLQRHQASCSWEHRRRQDPAQRPSSAGSVPRAGSPPRWAARPVASDQPAENAVTLPCEFCEQAFLDADLLRHQLRCEKNPQRLDLPAGRAPQPRSGGLTRSRSDCHADRQPEPEPEPDGRSTRSGWRQQELVSRSSRRERQQESPSRPGWRERLAAELEYSPLRRPSGRLRGELPSGRLRGELPSETGGDAAPRRWSLLDHAEEVTPSAPQRKSKHKKKVNFLGEVELIQPPPDQTTEVVDGDKKKKRSKEEKKQRKEEKKLKKRSSKKHRAPEPPGEPAIACDY